MARGGGESEETLAQEWRKVKAEIRRRRNGTRDSGRLREISQAEKRKRSNNHFNLKKSENSAF